MTCVPSGRPTLPAERALSVDITNLFKQIEAKSLNE